MKLWRLRHHKNERKLSDEGKDSRIAGDPTCFVEDLGMALEVERHLWVRSWICHISVTESDTLECDALCDVAKSVANQ